ncbi:hypothetical protein [Caldivirga sp. MU80]|uniref:hypothetical protein n=1 Tax=Caldivirga sp. MU80 TaxID=1650354 RepID=UPI0008336C00|nr:hypothetical protein [Caldivirga sp. MU80]
MRFESKLASLVAAVVLAAVIASVLLLIHAANKQGTRAEANFNAPESMGIILNVPVYVVGPQSLIRRLVGVGVPQSLIKPINLSQLPSLPGNSTVLIGYSVIKPSVVVGVVNGVVRLNLTSPVIALLISLVAKGDLIMLYGNSSDLMAMEYLLAYTWAKKYGTLYLNYLNGRGVPSNYLIAYPIIPINSKEALAMAFGGPHYLVIGPAMPRDVLWAVAVYESLRYTFSIASLFSSLPDPEVNYLNLCYYIYEWYSSVDHYLNGKWSSDSYLILAFPIVSSRSYEPPSIMGYSDGNGTFYYDTCLEVSTQVWVTATPPNIPAYVYGYVGYRLSETMANNGGEVLSETGTIDYYTSYRYYNESITNSFVGSNTGRPQLVHLTTGYGFSEGISLNYGPSTQAYGYPADNVTWRFRFSHANNPGIDYYNDFDDPSPNWIMPYPLGLQPFYAYLPVYMSVEVLTGSRCYLIFAENTYEYVWVDGGWWLTAQPMGSSTGLVPSAASYIPSQQLPGTYVSGVASWSAPTLELCRP